MCESQACRSWQCDGFSQLCREVGDRSVCNMPVCVCLCLCLYLCVCSDWSPLSFCLSVVSDTVPQVRGICFPRKQLSSQVGCLHFLSSPAVPESLVSQSEGQGNLLAISLAAKLFSLQLPLLQLAELTVFLYLHWGFCVSSLWWTQYYSYWYYFPL